MKLRMFLTLTLVLGSFAGAHAAADEESAKWLEKLFGLIDEQAVRAEYTLTANGMQQGMQIYCADILLAPGRREVGVIAQDLRERAYRGQRPG